MTSVLDLPTELQSEIFGLLKQPYTLYNVSLTSMVLNQRALTNQLWDKHFESEFPYSLEKTGSSFQKYTVCKRNSLKHFDDPQYRKLAILLEASHLTEFKELLPKCKPNCNNFLIPSIRNKSLTLMINELKDEEFRTHCFKFIKKGLSPEDKAAFALLFGQFESLQNYPSDTNKAAILALSHGDKETLDYLFLRGVTYKPQCLALAAEKGNLEIVKWLLEHGATVNSESFKAAAASRNVEVLNYFLETFEVTQEDKDCAILSAIPYQPSILEILLPLGSFDNLDFLFNFFNFKNSTDETHASLKLLLDKGARPDTAHLLGACSQPNNEISIERLLEHGADPNFRSYGITPISQVIHSLKKKNIIEILLNHGATPIYYDLKEAEKLLQKEPDNQELLEIINLLKERISQ